MASIVIGNDLGVQNSSLNKVGANNLDGLGTSGKAGEQVYVNTATGNLIIQNVDESLVGAGIDSVAVRTYNQFGQWNGKSNDNWRIGFYRRVYNLTGTLNAVGSTVTKTNADGSESLYTFDANTGKYVTTEGAGAHQTLSYDDANSEWTWSDAQGDVSETYSGNHGYWKIVSSSSRAGEVTNYIYDWEGYLIRLEDSSGQRLNLAYDDDTGLLDAITVFCGEGGNGHYTNRYYYDAQYRLERVVVDLSPENFSISDGNTYTTEYTYDGTSDRIATIRQTDGTHVGFTYEEIGGIYKVKAMTDAQGDTTVFTYGTGSTDVQDALGNITTFHYDAQNRLTKIEQPAIDGIRSTVQYEYNDPNDADNITKIIDANGNEVVYDYDANGNQIYQRDQLGNVIERTYNASNQLETETIYMVADPDGEGAGQPQDPQTSRFVYYPSGYLAYTINAEGGVIMNEWDNATGNLEATTQFTQDKYDISQLGQTQIPTATQMDNWVSSQVNKSQAIKKEYAYDFRGQVMSTTTYSELDSLGNGVESSKSTTYFVYDAKGRLLKTVDPRAASATDEPYASHITYDGLGRVLTTTDAADAVTTTVYDDANNKVIVTSQSGLVTTSTFNAGGELISITQAGDGQTYSETSYEYDAAGNLIKEIDTDGNISKNIYDAQNRLVGTIDKEGYLTEIKYDASGNIIETIKYETKVDGIYNEQLTANDEQLVNTTTYRTQSIPQATKLANGNYVVVWHSDNGSYGWDVMAQIMSADGQKIGNELRLNQGHGSAQYAPTIAALAKGGFVAAWRDDGTDTGNIHFRRFDDQGNAIDNDRIACTYSDNKQDNPEVVGLANGGFVISWDSDSATDDDNSYNGIYARYYDADGEPQGAEQRVNTVTYHQQTGSAIASLDDGGYVITWTSYNQGGNEGEIWGQRYDALGQKVGSEFHINEDTTAYQTSSDVIGLRDGGFIVTWSDRSSGDYDIKARYYDSEGTANGSEFILNTQQTDNQTASTMSQLSDGSLLFVWESVGQDGDSYSVVGQRFTATGKKIGSEFQVNQTITANQYYPEIIALEGGKAAAIWGSTGQADDTSGGAIVVRHFQIQENINNLRPQTSENDAITKNIYDDAGRLVYTVDAEGYVLENVYDAFGNVVEAKRHTNSVTWAENGGVETINGPSQEISIVVDNNQATTEGVDEWYRSSAISGYEGDDYQLRKGTGENSIAWQAEVSDLYEQEVFARWTDGAERTSAAKYNIHHTDAFGNQAISTVTVDQRINGSQWISLGKYWFSNGVGKVVLTDETPDDYVIADAVKFVGQTAAEDSVSSKLIYNNAGQLVYTVDAEGYVSESVYDAVGQVIETKSYDKQINAAAVVTAHDVEIALSTTFEQNFDNNYDGFTSNDLQSHPELIAHEDGCIKFTGATLGSDTWAEIVSDAKPFAAEKGYRFEVTTENVTTEYLLFGLTEEGTWGDNGFRVHGAFINDGNVSSYQYQNNSADTQYKNPVEANTTYVVEIETVSSGSVIYVYEKGMARESGWTNTFNTTGWENIQFKMWNKGGPAENGGSFKIDNYMEYDVGSEPESASSKLIYDNAGRLVYSINNTGHVTENKYDESGNVISTTQYYYAINPSSINTVADVQSALTLNVQDRTVQTKYDERGLVTDVLSGEGSSKIAQGADEAATWNQYATKFEYDAMGRSISVTDANGHKTLFFYDQRGLQTHTVKVLKGQNLGEVTETKFNAFGDIEETVVYANTIDTTGLIGGSVNSTLENRVAAASDTTKDTSTQFEYSTRGLLTKTIDALNNEIRTKYNAFGQVEQTIDQTGTITQFEYDKLGNVLKTIQDLNGNNITTTTKYDAFGRAIESTDANGNVTKVEYDKLGRVIVTEDALGNDTIMTYDAFGRVLTQTDALGHTTTYTYDDANNSVTITNAEGFSTTTISNDFGEQDTIIDAKGNQTTFEYNHDGQLLKVTDAEGNESQTIYDQGGRTFQTIDAKGTVTELEYDSGNRLYKRTLDKGGIEQTTTYGYDHKGQSTTVTDANNTVTKTIYNKAGQVEKVIHDEGGLNIITAYSYDAKGNQVSVTEAQGTAQERTTKFIYDDLNRLIRTIDAEGYVTESKYDSLDNVIETIRYEKKDIIFDITDNEIPSGWGYSASREGYLGEKYYYFQGANGDGTHNYTWQTEVELPVEQEVFARWTSSGNRATDVKYIIYHTDENGNETTTEVFRNQEQNGGQWVSLGKYAFGTGTVKVELCDTANEYIIADAFKVEAATIKGAQSTKFVYDSLGRVTQIIDAEGYVTENEYDSLGNVVATHRYDPGADLSINQTTVIVEDNTVTNIASDASWSSGVVSGKEIVGNGFAEFKNGIEEKAIMVGLNKDPLSDRSIEDYFRQLEYAIYITGSGDLCVYENGINKTTISGVHEPDNAYRIEVDGDKIRYVYLKSTGEKVEFYTTTRSDLSETYYLDISLHNLGAQVKDIKVVSDKQTTKFVYDSLGRVTHTIGAEDHVSEHEYDVLGNVIATHSYDSNGSVSYSSNHRDVSIVGDEVTSIASAETWVTGASSKESIANGKGYVEFAIASPETSQIIGLNANPISNRAISNYYQQLEYAFFIDPQGNINFYESGDFVSNSSNITKHTATNKYRIEVDGNKINYIVILEGGQKEILRTITRVNNDAEYYFDMSLCHPGTKITDIKLYSGATTTSYVYDSLGRVTHTIDAEGYVAESKYDSLGNVVETIRYEKTDIIFDITDNEIPSGWGGSTSAAGYYGNKYYYILGTNGDGSHNYTWQTDVELPVQQEVFTHWAASTNRATDVKYKIYHTDENGNETITEVIRNQKINGGKWVSLGKYTFGTGTVKVELCDTANEYIIADAFKVEAATLEGARSTKFVYDSLGRVTHTIDAEGYVTESEYNALGQVEVTRRYESNGSVSYNDNHRYVSIDGDEATSIASGTTWVTGASSNEKITDGKGFVEFAIGSTGTSQIVGLNSDPVSNRAISNYFQQLEYAFYIDSASGLYFYESGNFVANTSDITSHSASNKYQIEVDGDQINYIVILEDGQREVVRAVTRSDLGAEYHFDMSLCHPGTKITDIKLYSDVTTTNFVYDDLGRVKYSFDALGYLTINEYDSLSNLVLQAKTTYTKVSDDAATNKAYFDGMLHAYGYGQDAIISRYVYDDLGRVLYTLDALGNVSENEYNSLGQVVLTKRFESAYTGSVYTQSALDAAMSVVESVEQRFVYDDLGRVLFTIDAEGYVTENKYDSFGNITESKRYSTPISLDRTDWSEAAISHTAKYIYYKSEDFSDANLESFGIINHDALYIENEQAVFKRADADSYWPCVYGKHYNKFADNLTNKFEVTTGSVLSDNYLYGGFANNGSFGSGGTLFRHFVYFRNGQVQVALHENGEGKPYILLGDQKVNTTYVVEYVTTKDTSTMYVYEKGLGRNSGWSHALDVNDDEWGATRLQVYSNSSPGGSGAELYLDNIEIYKANEASTTKYIYNDLGQARFTINAEGYVTENEYDALGSVVATKRFGNVYTGAALTEAALETFYANKESIDEQVVYNSIGQVRFTIDAMGYVSENEYNAFGQVVTTNRYSEDTVYTGSVYTEQALEDAVSGAASVEQSFVYDDLGRTRYSIDGTGYVTESRYTALGQVASTHRYDAPYTGTELTEEALDDFFGTELLTMSSVYDDLGRLRFEIDALTYVKEHKYDAFGNNTKVIRYAEDLGTHSLTLSELESQSLTAQKTSTFVYDSLGRVRYSVDALGHVVETVYNSLGQIEQTISYGEAINLGSLPLNAKESDVASLVSGQTDLHKGYLVYNDLGQERFSIDSRGVVTEKIYNALGLVEQTKVYLTAVSFDSNPSYAEMQAAVENIAQTDIATTTFEYDKLGQMVAATDAEGNYESYIYDGYGNKVTYTNQRGYTWSYDHNALGMVIEEETPEVEVSRVDSDMNVTTTRETIKTKLVYDSRGNIKEKIEAYGTADERTTTYHYDALGRQIRVEYPQSGVFIETSADDATTRQETVQSLTDEFKYDSLGNKAVIKNTGNGYSYNIYDLMGRVIYEIDAERYVTEHKYDALGNETELTRYADQISLGAHTAGEIISESTKASIESQLGSMSVRTHTTYYNALGRVVKTVDPQVANYDAEKEQGYMASPTIENQYDLYGNLQKQSVLTYSNSGSEEWAHTYYYYDAGNNKVGMIDAEGYVTSYSYDEQGNVEKQIEYATAYESAFDENSDFGQVVANIPKVTGQESGSDREIWTYYDKLGRKTKEVVKNAVYEGAATPTDITTEFKYDAAGNNILTIDDHGNETHVYYDELGRTEAVAEPSRISESSGYMPLLKVSKSHPQFGSTAIVWDASVVSGTVITIEMTNGGSTTTLTAQEIDGLYGVDVSGLGTGTFTYELNYTKAGEATPYITGTGDIEITANGSARVPQTTGNVIESASDLQINLPANVDSTWYIVDGGENYGALINGQISWSSLSHWGTGDVRTTVSYSNGLNYVTTQNAANGDDGISINYNHVSDDSHIFESVKVEKQVDGRWVTFHESSYSYSSERLDFKQVGTGATDVVFEYRPSGTEQNYIQKQADKVGDGWFAANYDDIPAGIYEYRLRVNGSVQNSGTVTLLHCGDSFPELTGSSAQVLTPLTTFKQNIFGQVVEQTRHAKGAQYVGEYGYGAALADAANDQTEVKAYDALGQEIKSRDAEGGLLERSYTATGKVAKEWMHVVNNERIIEKDKIVHYEYDALGNQLETREVLEDGRVSTTSAYYNAFGEVDEKHINGEIQKFEYDAAGRVWRSNDQAGVPQIQLYDLVGNKTAALVSNNESTDLRGVASAQSALSLRSGVQRTEYIHDDIGRIVTENKAAYTTDPNIDGVVTDFREEYKDGKRLLVWDKADTLGLNPVLKLGKVGSALSAVTIDKSGSHTYVVDISSYATDQYAYELTYYREWLDINDGGEFPERVSELEKKASGELQIMGGSTSGSQHIIGVSELPQVTVNSYTEEKMEVVDGGEVYQIIPHLEMSWSSLIGWGNGDVKVDIYGEKPEIITVVSDGGEVYETVNTIEADGGEGDTPVLVSATETRTFTWNEALTGIDIQTNESFTSTDRIVVSKNVNGTWISLWDTAPNGTFNKDQRLILRGNTSGLSAVEIRDENDNYVTTLSTTNLGGGVYSAAINGLTEGAYSFKPVGSSSTDKAMFEVRGNLASKTVHAQESRFWNDLPAMRSADSWQWIADHYGETIVIDGGEYSVTSTDNPYYWADGPQGLGYYAKASISYEVDPNTGEPVVDGGETVSFDGSATQETETVTKHGYYFSLSPYGYTVDTGETTYVENDGGEQVETAIMHKPGFHESATLPTRLGGHYGIPTAHEAETAGIKDNQITLNWGNLSSLGDGDVRVEVDYRGLEYKDVDLSGNTMPLQQSKQFLNTQYVSGEGEWISDNYNEEITVVDGGEYVTTTNPFYYATGPQGAGYYAAATSTQTVLDGGEYVQETVTGYKFSTSPYGQDATFYAGGTPPARIGGYYGNSGQPSINLDWNDLTQWGNGNVKVEVDYTRGVFTEIDPNQNTMPARESYNTISRSSTSKYLQTVENDDFGEGGFFYGNANIADGGEAQSTNYYLGTNPWYYANGPRGAGYYADADWTQFIDGGEFGEDTYVHHNEYGFSTNRNGLGFAIYDGDTPTRIATSTTTQGEARVNLSWSDLSSWGSGYVKVQYNYSGKSSSGGSTFSDTVTRTYSASAAKSGISTTDFDVSTFSISSVNSINVWKQVNGYEVLMHSVGSSNVTQRNIEFTSVPTNTSTLQVQYRTLGSSGGYTTVNATKRGTGVFKMDVNPLSTGSYEYILTAKDSSGSAISLSNANKYGVFQVAKGTTPLAAKSNAAPPPLYSEASGNVYKELTSANGATGIDITSFTHQTDSVKSIQSVKVWKVVNGQDVLVYTAGGTGYQSRHAVEITNLPTNTTQVRLRYRELGSSGVFQEIYADKRGNGWFAIDKSAIAYGFYEYELEAWNGSTTVNLGADANKQGVLEIGENTLSLAPKTIINTLADPQQFNHTYVQVLSAEAGNSGTRIDQTELTTDSEADLNRTLHDLLQMNNVRVYKEVSGHNVLVYDSMLEAVKYAQEFRGQGLLDHNVDYLQVSYREEGSTDSFRTRTATKRGNGWFKIDTADLDNGTYEYTLLAKSNGQVVDLGAVNSSGVFKVNRVSKIWGTGDDAGKLLVPATAYLGSEITYKPMPSVYQERGIADTSQADVTNTPQVTMELDRWGNVIEANDANGNISQYKYDRNNNILEEIGALVQVTGEDGITRQQNPTKYSHYDSLGNLVKEVDQNGNTVIKEYDAAGNLVKETDDVGGIQKFTFDALGRKTMHDRGAGIIVNYEYDRKDNVTREYRDRQSVTYKYDSLGTCISQTNGNGETIQYDYDTRGKKIWERKAGGQETTYQYDLNGNKTRVDNANGDFMTWEYDAYGQVLKHTNLGGQKFEKIYSEQTGKLIIEREVEFNDGAGKELNYAYNESGMLTSIEDVTQHTLTSYEYDNNGNRIRETFQQGDNVYQDAKVTYDSHNRIAEVWDVRYTMTYKYDAVGNRRNTKSEYYNVNNELKTQDYWYKYDARNRITISQGVLNEDTNQIWYTADQGTHLEYDGAGNRRAATFYDGSNEVSETYIYDADNMLVRTTRDGLNTSVREYDAVGRMTKFTTYENGSIKGYRTTRYNENGLTLIDSTYEGGSLKYRNRYYDSVETDISNNYDAEGNLLKYHTQVYGDNGYTNTITKSYYKFDGYMERGVVGTSSHFLRGNTESFYDENNNLIRVEDLKDSTKNRHFIANTEGKILQKTQDGNVQYYHYLNGNSLGTSGKDSAGKDVTDFDMNYTPVNENYPKATPSGYTVSKGDTLEIISFSLYGDASLWYLIADANGLNGNADLQEGMSLTIPNTVTNIHNNSNTYKPYNAGEIIGDTTPTMPDPPPPPAPKGCGVLGMIALIVVAVVVTIFTAGAAAAALGPMVASAATAAGAASLTALSAVATITTALGAAVGAMAASVVTQGLMMATGHQDKFSWKDVGRAGVTAFAGSVFGSVAGAMAKSGSLGTTAQGSKWASAAVEAAASNTGSQIASIAMDDQRGFSWKSVASSAVSAGVMKTDFGKGVNDELGGLGSNLLSGALKSGVRSALGDDKGVRYKQEFEGKDYWVEDDASFNWESVVKDAVGSYLGNMIGGTMKAAYERETWTDGLTKEQLADLEWWKQESYKDYVEKSISDSYFNDNVDVYDGIEYQKRNAQIMDPLAEDIASTLDVPNSYPTFSHADVNLGIGGPNPLNNGMDYRDSGKPRRFMAPIGDPTAGVDSSFIDFIKPNQVNPGYGNVGNATSGVDVNNLHKSIFIDQEKVEGVRYGNLSTYNNAVADGIGGAVNSVLAVNMQRAGASESTIYAVLNELNEKSVFNKHKAFDNGFVSFGAEVDANLKVHTDSITETFSLLAADINAEIGVQESYKMVLENGKMKIQMTAIETSYGVLDNARVLQKFRLDTYITLDADPNATLADYRGIFVENSRGAAAGVLDGAIEEVAAIEMQIKSVEGKIDALESQRLFAEADMADRIVLENGKASNLKTTFTIKEFPKLNFAGKLAYGLEVVGVGIHAVNTGLAANEVYETVYSQSGDSDLAQEAANAEIMVQSTSFVIGEALSIGASAAATAAVAFAWTGPGAAVAGAIAGVAAGVAAGLVYGFVLEDGVKSNILRPMIYPEKFGVGSVNKFDQDVSDLADLRRFNAEAQQSFVERNRNTPMAIFENYSQPLNLHERIRELQIKVNAK